MMSTARFCPAHIPEPLRLFIGAALALLACGFAAPGVHAATSGCSKPVNINADYTSGLGRPNGVVHLRGHVVITQCTLKITAAKANIHLDANVHAKRVVLTGTPAHVRQVNDQGQLVKLHANHINYVIATGVATLTGHAYGTQVGSSTISAAKIVYNTQTTAMHARSNGSHRVHMTFQPHQSTTAGNGAAPASTSGHAAAQPAPASSAVGH